MDGGEGIPIDLIETSESDQRSNLNISDVFEAISIADPMFAAESSLGPGMARVPPGGPFVRIVEQPASKALRFRYECEGRSAGSIPGVNSSQDRKTYPTIEICGHTGKAIVVVSCVTKDEPYRPHPHNLVGRDRCNRGVCTLKTEVSPDSCLVSFSNLGIQCVKRRDIGDALRVREELRVDPFKTGYAHRNQPQSIDLNAVRLCFQVFLPDDQGRIRHTLRPAVSDVIYDKKAMSDLQILRVSRSSGTARGGTEIILLCEKVTREDTAVVLVEEETGIAWEDSATIIVVHKQVAIAFTTPPYRDPHTNRHVEVQIQLKRISDNARSAGVPFTYIPEHQGTIAKPLPDLSVLSMLLQDRRDTNNNDNDNRKDDALVTSTSDAVSQVIQQVTISDVNGNIEIIDDETETTDIVASNEKSLNDLLDQVAELDEIYSENRTRLENVTVLNNDTEVEEDFNDAGTYTSLQLAFKNPVSISETQPFDDVPVHTYRGPIIEFTALKRDTDDERAPPLPPKRVRKTSEQFKTSQTSVESILKPGKQIPISRLSDAVERSNGAPTREVSVARSEPALPPVKKRSFFSRLFRKRDKSPAPSVESEGKNTKSKHVGRSVSSVSGTRPNRFKSAVSHTSLKDNASTTGLSYADSITHISLHGDENEKSASTYSLRRSDLPPTDGGTILVAESVLALDASQFKKLQDDLDLTEAEHYALYMAVAPHATVSEFDETSCHYQPIDDMDYLKRKRQKTSLLQQIEQETAAWQQEQKIKSEPSDKGSPLHVGSSPHRVYTPLEQMSENPYQQWVQDAIQGVSVNIPGPSVNPSYSNPYNSEWQGQSYQTLTPNMQVLNVPSRSPNMPVTSPSLQVLSPNMQVMTPSMQAMTPSMQAMSPNMQVMSPNMQAMSPNMQAMSPNMQAMSPVQAMSPQGQVMSPHMAMDTDRQCRVSPSLGQVSPNLGHVSPNLVQQPPMIQQQMEGTNSTPSLSKLLMDQGESMAPIQINSGDLSNLSALLGQNYRSNELSDSLNRLSTSDLLNPAELQ